MIDLLIILLIAFIILLILQIVTILKVRRFLGQLRKILYQLTNIKSIQQNKLLPDQLHNCQFCKYRASYIKMNAAGNDDDFYYRCKLHSRKVSLTSTCKQFQFDIEV